MTGNNPNQNLVNSKAYVEFGQIPYPFVLKIISGNEILTSIKGHNSGTNEKKMTSKNPNLDLIKINAYKIW